MSSTFEGMSKTFQNMWNFYFQYCIGIWKTWAKANLHRRVLLVFFKNLILRDITNPNLRLGLKGVGNSGIGTEPINEATMF